jgi:uncharacterized protein (DUF3084 family)
MMYKDAITDELRQIELDVVEGERRTAELEALLIELKRLNEDTTKVQAELVVAHKNLLDCQSAGLRQDVLGSLK